MLQHDSSPFPEYEPKKIKIKAAVGTTLAHDITEVKPGEYKSPSFRKGHKIERKDLCHLMRLGKRHLYILDLNKDQVHEDDAVLELAMALSGPGITFGGQPIEGKIQLKAAYHGLFKVNVNPLIDFNLIPEVMCASIHNNTPVKKGQSLAGTRAIPLVIHQNILDKAVDIARTHYPVFSVKVFNPCKVRLIITGNEVYDGLIEDKFEAVVTEKLKAYGASLVETVILPDDEVMIADSVRLFLDQSTDLIMPGAMFQLAYKGDVPIAGIPACALYHKTTIFDLILPRLLAGEKPDNKDLARFAHGGLCLDCHTCRFPGCSFGKTG